MAAPAKGPGKEFLEILMAGKSILCGMARGGRACIIAIVALLLRLGAGGVDLARIEASSPVLVLEEFVSAGNFLETGLGRLVVGMQVRMMFLGELLEGGLDFRIARRLLEAENLIGIFHSVRSGIWHGMVA